MWQSPITPLIVRNSWMVSTWEPVKALHTWKETMELSYNADTYRPVKTVWSEITRITFTLKSVDTSLGSLTFSPDHSFENSGHLLTNSEVRTLLCEIHGNGTWWTLVVKPWFTAKHMSWIDWTPSKPVLTSDHFMVNSAQDSNNEY